MTTETQTDRNYWKNNKDLCNFSSNLEKRH
jgi:hypothetical protein